MVKLERVLPSSLSIFLWKRIVRDGPLVVKICCSFIYGSSEHTAAFRPEIQRRHIVLLTLQECFKLRRVDNSKYSSRVLQIRILSISAQKTAVATH